MATPLDTLLIGQFTAGINTPAPTTDAGYGVRVNAAGDNLDYVEPKQSVTGSGTWNRSADTVLVFGSGARTIIIPDGDIVGRVVTVVDAAGSAGAGNITVDPAGTVNGAGSVVLSSNYASARLVYVAASTWVRV